ncbi:Fic family protein [Ectothiorhodospira shaposhnikovii]|uniref:Fic family protein n=1 Tax=Ectothiorhodospira shaposhnikovii TaxID=1054 RepID=UPI0039A0CF80
MTPKLPINLNSLLHHRTIESERVEYKAGWNPEAVLHSICAFANDFHNMGGGYVVVGVAEQNGQPVLPPVGLQPEQIDRIQKELLNLGNAALQPPYHPLTATYEVQGKLILVLWVPGGETRPYKARVRLGDKNTEWAFYLRKHTSTVRAKGVDERELLSLAATVPFDDRYRQNASLTDLSPHLMREFLQEIGSELAGEASNLDVEALGRRMNVVDGPAEMVFPKNVGLLFFNEHPEQFFPATQIDVVYFPDGPGGDRFEEKEFRGPLGRITRDAVDYIARNYLKEAVIKHPDRPQAERFWNYPLAAIEEAVVNAVYHRSYEIREPIEVRITPEELLVLSFPGPDRSIRMEDLQAGRAVSRRYRNRRIGEFLKELDLTEGRSTGIPKILRVMQANGSPQPRFESDDERSSFLIRLPVHEGFVEGHGPEVTPEVTGEVGTKSGLSRDQVRVIQACEEDLPLTGLMAVVGRSNRSKFRGVILNPLLEAGLIEMTIPSKPRSRLQRYRVTNKGKIWLKARKE